MSSYVPLLAEHVFNGTYERANTWDSVFRILIKITQAQTLTLYFTTDQPRVKIRLRVMQHGKEIATTGQCLSYAELPNVQLPAEQCDCPTIDLDCPDHLHHGPLLHVHSEGEQHHQFSGAAHAARSDETFFVVEGLAESFDDRLLLSAEGKTRKVLAPAIGKPDKKSKRRGTPQNNKGRKVPSRQFSTMDEAGVNWCVRAYVDAGDGCTMALSNMLQDAVDAQKHAWEAMQPGRSAIATALRHQYLLSNGAAGFRDAKDRNRWARMVPAEGSAKSASLASSSSAEATLSDIGSCGGHRLESAVRELAPLRATPPHPLSSTGLRYTSTVVASQEPPCSSTVQRVHSGTHIAARTPEKKVGGGWAASRFLKMDEEDSNTSSLPALPHGNISMASRVRCFQRKDLHEAMRAGSIQTKALLQEARNAYRQRLVEARLSLRNKCVL